MNRNLSKIALACLSGSVLVWPCVAQSNNRLTFAVGGGFTEPVRNTDGRLNTGFNVNAGAGINFVPQLGVLAEFGFNDLNLSSAALAAAGVPDGSTRIYSVTANPIVRFNPHGRFDAYIIGGGGFYRRTVEFTKPTIATVTGV